MFQATNCNMPCAGVSLRLSVRKQGGLTKTGYPAGLPPLSLLGWQPSPSSFSSYVLYKLIDIHTHGISDRNKTGQESLSKPKINATFYFYRSARNPLFFIAFNNYIKYGI